MLIIGTFSIAFIFPSIFRGTEPEEETTPTNSDTEDGTNQIKIVDKQIPPGYVMGNPIDVELVSGMSALFIKDSMERVSIRFTAKFSGEATTLTINAMAREGQPQIRVGLQEDSAGLPKGEWMNEQGFGISQISSERGFVTVKLERTVSISKGRVYHMVIESVATEDSITIFTYMANGYAQPLNEEDPDIVSPDPMMNTLSYDGKDWREENKWPIFVIGYTDGSSEGQPYSLAAPWVIYGSTYVGQTIIPASNYRIGKMAFVVGLKGEPTDRLYFEIRDTSNEVMAKGLFANTSQLIGKTWIEITLPSPVTFKAGELYRIVLLSPGTELKNAYYVYGTSSATTVASDTVDCNTN